MAEMQRNAPPTYDNTLSSPFPAVPTHALEAHRQPQTTLGAATATAPAPASATATATAMATPAYVHQAAPTLLIPTPAQTQVSPVPAVAPAATAAYAAPIASNGNVLRMQQSEQASPLYPQLPTEESKTAIATTIDTEALQNENAHLRAQIAVMQENTVLQGQVVALEQAQQAQAQQYKQAQAVPATQQQQQQQQESRGFFGSISRAMGNFFSLLGEEVSELSGDLSRANMNPFTPPRPAGQSTAAPPPQTASHSISMFADRHPIIQTARPQPSTPAAAGYPPQNMGKR